MFDVEEKQKRLQVLDKTISKKDFWQSPEKAKAILKERNLINEELNNLEELRKQLEDAEILFQLAAEEDDQAAMEEVSESIKNLKEEIDKLTLSNMLKDENDSKNAIVSINAGAGGTEAQDWAEMLFRMYLRWAEEKGYSTEIADFQAGEEAGIKSVTFTVRGNYAYGYLKVESGIHRLVRISPFDASRKRHTSFASVFVYPEVEDEINIEIDEKDLRIDTFRASGAGGQHVNKTSSAVRITHLPTGIVVQCQQESSQHRNRSIAMMLLRSRLYEHERQKKEKEKQAIYENQDEIAWGSQIRSYILHPYQLVKDHRTSVEIGDVNGVLDGNLDPFIREALMCKNKRRWVITPVSR
nr:peptide chain release factor 2 [Desulfobacterales bacterium]